MLWAYFTLFAFSSASSFCLISPFYNIAVVKRIMRIKIITVHWQSRASLDPSHWKYETYFSISWENLGHLINFYLYDAYDTRVMR